LLCLIFVSFLDDQKIVAAMVNYQRCNLTAAMQMMHGLPFQCADPAMK